MAGVRAHCVNGVHDSVVVACEIEGLVGVASANDMAWGWHTNVLHPHHLPDSPHCVVTFVSVVVV